MDHLWIIPHSSVFVNKTELSKYFTNSDACGAIEEPSIFIAVNFQKVYFELMKFWKEI